MLVTMPNVKEELKEALETIDRQKYQIEKLQRDLRTMYYRLREFDEQTSNTK